MWNSNERAALLGSDFIYFYILDITITKLNIS